MRCFWSLVIFLALSVCAAAQSTSGLDWRVLLDRADSLAQRQQFAAADSVYALLESALPDQTAPAQRKTIARARLRNQTARGNALMASGHAAEAIPIHRLALQSALPLLGVTDTAVADAWFYLGVVHYLESNYQQTAEAAQHCYEARLALLGANHALTLRAVNLHAAAFHKLGDLERAVQLYDQIIAVPEEADWYSRALSNKALVLTDLQQYDAAVQCFRTILQFRIANDYSAKDIGTTLMNIGFMYKNAGQCDSAMAYLNRAQPLKEQAEGAQHYNIGLLHNYRAACLMRENKPLKALAELEKANAIFVAARAPGHPVVASVHVSIAEAWAAAGRSDSARWHYRTAREILGGRDAQSDLEYTQDVTELLPILTSEARFYSDLAQASAQPIPLLDSSLAAHIQALETIDQMRRYLFNNQSNEHWSERIQGNKGAAMHTALELYRHTGEQAYLATAFNIAERSRSVQLLKSLRFLENADDAPSALIAREKAVNAELSAINQQLAESQGSTDSLKAGRFRLQQSRDSVLEALQREFPSYYATRFNLTPATLQELRNRAIDPSTAVLEYLLGDEHLYLLVITSEGIHLIETTYDAALLNTRNAFLAELQSPTLGAKSEAAFNEWCAASHRLYRALMAPADSVLRSNPKSTLVIVPDGWIGAVPFSALLQSAPIAGQATYRDVPYLMHNYAISYAYSATALVQQLQGSKNPATGQCSGWAPQSFTQTVLPELPHSAQEIETAMQLVGGQVHLGQRATKQRFMASVTDSMPDAVVHLATHAIAARTNPYLSNIWFSDSAGSSNPLTGYEIHNLDMHCALLVLSACETGAGYIGTGEGVQSLGWSFLNSGCNTVLATHWTTNDAATSQHMQLFYNELLAAAPLPQTLQQATQRYLQHADALHAHPHYWAGFALMGSTKAVMPTGGHSPFDQRWLILLAAFCLVALIALFRK